MTRNYCRLFACFLVAAVFTIVPVFAQSNLNEDQGLKPYDSFHGGDLDSVSLTNGSLALHIPLVSFPQRGNLDLGFSIRYSSKGWHVFFPPNKGATKRWQPTVNTGAQIVSSVDWWMQSNTHTDSSVTPYVTTWSQSATSPDGNAHLLGGQIDGSGTTYPLRSLDASGLLHPDLNTLVLSDGTVYKYPNMVVNTGSSGGGIDGVQASLVTDANGNQITINSSGWTDTLGRVFPGSARPTLKFGIQPGVATTDLSACPAGTASAQVFTVPGVAPGNSTSSSSTGTRTFTFCYSNVTLSTAFNPGVPPTDYPATSTSLLTAVVLPDSTMWNFAYDNYGEITRLGFPTGGSISYTYDFGPGATCLAGMALTQGSRWVRPRTV